MHRIILMLILVVLSSSAMAEWIKIGSSNNLTAYAEPSTIRKAGNRVKMWSMYDFDTAKIHTDTGKPYMSARGQTEFDCKEEQYRTLSFTLRSENMDRGEVVFTSSEIHNWNPIAPRSIDETLWKIACRKR